MATSTVISRTAAGLLLLLSGAAGAREAASPASCQAAAAEPAVVSVRAALDAAPDDLHVRFKLADAWSDLGCFGEAIRVLQGGEARHPRDEELQERMRVAKSLVSEQRYFDQVDQAAKDARFTRAAFRCSKLGELISCDEALDMRPNDPALLDAEADALVRLKRPGEAIGVYRNSLREMPNQAQVAAKIIAAEAQRKGLLDVCETQTGEAARRACESAWLPGAPDEAKLFVRRALLLQEDNQLSVALDAYMAAARLRPGDSAIASAIVSLTDSTRRTDSITLTAKGAALNALGRPAEALLPLHQALRQSPDLAAARAQLQIAERTAVLSMPVRVAALPHALKPVHDELAATPRFSNDAPVTRSN